MSGIPCSCPKESRKWAVRHRHGNYSAFNGYHWTPSDYSSVVCLVCEGVWRTKAKYVDKLPDCVQVLK